ncbi:MAG: glycosyl transferase family 1 [Desulfovibrio sp.]|nr:glycosyl transferase family 1 [Desulfovibrio sp.]
MQKQLIFVLGMHRSGTSTLTRALACLGVDIGKKTQGRFDNPKGFFEDEDFVALNQKLLQTLDVPWDSLKSIESEKLMDLASGELGDAAKYFLNERCQDNIPLALKDPRASRLFIFWRRCAEELHFGVHCLISLRHPLSCADSLLKRDAMPREKSLVFWLSCMQDCLRTSEFLPRLVVAYDRLLDYPDRELQRIGYFLQREVSSEKVKIFLSTFLDSSLRHHKYGLEGTKNQILSHAMRLYSALDDCSVSLDPQVFQCARLKRLAAYPLCDSYVL